MATTMAIPRPAAEGRGRYVREIPEPPARPMSYREQATAGAQQPNSFRPIAAGGELPSAMNTGSSARPMSYQDEYNKSQPQSALNRMAQVPVGSVDDDGNPIPGYSPAPSGGAGAPGYSNRYTGNNVNSMISSDREFAFGRGDELFQNSKDRAANEGNLRAYYRQYADEVYDPLIGGRGGYSQEESDAIMNDDFDGFMTNEDGYNSNFYSDEERAAIAGNPWDRAAYFDPDAMTARQNESAAKQRGAVDDMATGLYESLDGQLGLSDEYGRNVDSTLSSMEAGTRGAYDPAALRANADSLNRIRMTPEEEQAIVTKAGISGGMKYRAAAGEMDAKARAAGMDPVAAAAMRGRYLRNAAADSADAMTGARVQASNARAGREQAAEGLRMGGERTAADIGTGVELSLADRKMNANNTREGLRLKTEQDIADRRAGIATTIGQTRVGAEQQINNQGRQQAQFNAGLGTQIATGIEQDSSTRAQQIANNRQQNNRANQTQRFQQGMTKNEARSTRAQQIANARRDDAREGRGYVREQAGVSNQNQQGEYNRQVNIYGQQGQQIQNTTANQQRKDQQPKWWEKLVGAGIQAAGAFAGGGS